jgi:hypothetical protein
MERVVVAVRVAMRVPVSVGVPLRSPVAVAEGLTVVDSVGLRDAVLDGVGAMKPRLVVGVREPVSVRVAVTVAVIEAPMELLALGEGVREGAKDRPSRLATGDLDGLALGAAGSGAQ